MKYLIISVFYCSVINAQDKAVHMDSSWTELITDTIFGTIEYDLPLGSTMRGPGILVEYQSVDWTTTRSEFRRRIEVTNKYSGATKPTLAAFIKIKNGYKQVTGRYIFKPD